MNRHEKQRRKGADRNTPYIIHPITVADILISAGVTDPEIIAGALLHDTIEDTNTTREELVREFGERVARIVMDCSDDRTKHWIERKKEQIRHAPTLPDDSKLVKSADKIANVEDLVFNQTPWGVERTQGYITWAAAVYEGLRGVIPALDARFDAALTHDFHSSTAELHPAIPKDRTKEQILDEYLQDHHNDAYSSGTSCSVEIDLGGKK